MSGPPCEMKSVGIEAMGNLLSHHIRPCAIRRQLRHQRLFVQKYRTTMRGAFISLTPASSGNLALLRQAVGDLVVVALVGDEDVRLAFQSGRRIEAARHDR